jgi:hypothetical protein
MCPVQKLGYKLGEATMFQVTSRCFVKLTKAQLIFSVMRYGCNIFRHYTLKGECPARDGLAFFDMHA